MSQKSDAEYEWSSYVNESGSCFFFVKDSTEQINAQTADGKHTFDIEKARKLCADHGAQLPMLKRSGYQDQLQKRLNGTTRFALGLKRSLSNFHCKPETGSKPVDPQKRYCYTWEDGTEADNDFQATWSTKFTESAFTFVDFDSDQWVNAPADGLGENPVSVVCQEVLEEPPKPLVAAWTNKCLRGAKYGDYESTVVFNETDCYFLKHRLTNMSNKGSKATGYTFSLARAQEACESEGATLPSLEGTEEWRVAEAELITSNFSRHFLVWFQLRLNVKPLKLEQILIALSLRQVTHPKDWWWHSKSSLANQKFSDTPILETNEYAAYTTINEKRIWQNHDGRPLPAPVGVICKQPNSELNLGWCIGPKSPQIAIRKRYETSLCYFAVKDATQKVNQEKNGKFQFDFKKATELCQSYNATLAIASDPWRIQVLVDMIKEFSNGTEVGDVVLGLNQTIDGNRYTYTWDDGTQSEFYFQPVWPTKFDQAAYTIMSVRNLGSDVHVSWTNIKHSVWSDRPVHVVCQQPVPTLDPPKAPPAPLPKKAEPDQNVKTSHCGEQRKQKFSGAIYNYYANLICYFVIPGATTAANKRIEIEKAGGLNATIIRFSLNMAREKCQTEGGVLAAPSFDRYEEEYTFIATNFGPEVFAKTDPDLSGPVDFVAVGVSQLDSPNTYQWDVPETFERPPWQWIGENAYAYMTVMSLSPANMSYVNFQTDLIDQTIGVLCKYAVERIAPPPATDPPKPLPTFSDPWPNLFKSPETTVPTKTTTRPTDPGHGKQSTPDYDDGGIGSKNPMHYWALVTVGVLAMFWR